MLNEESKQKPNLDKQPAGEPTVYLPDIRLEKYRKELRERWEEGNYAGVEIFFDKEPDRDMRLRLICAELVLQLEFGHSIDLQKLCERFPDYKENIQAQLGWIQMLSEQAKENSTLTEVRKRPYAVVAIQIPGYRIREMIARGGMGAVYLAEEISLKNRPVALKLMLANDAHAERSKERFRREAEAVAQLRHANIVQIYAVGEWTPAGSTDSLPYIAMEYCGLGDLSTELAKTPQPPRKSAELVAILAKAVYFAHLNNIIHRDLKPKNILLGEGKQPKITDFGLAKHLDINEDFTETNTVLGTPAYMAPEQTWGKKDKNALSPSVDIYGLGAILYEMLTGRPPFQGTDFLETLEQVRNNDPISPRAIVPGIPMDLETITLKCLSKSPQHRYKSAQELAEDLERFLHGKPIVARPINWAERSIRWVQQNRALSGLLVVSAVAVLVVVGLTTWYLTNLGYARREQSVAERQAEVEQYYKLLSNMNERKARLGVGWTWNNLKDLHEATKIQQKHKVQTSTESLQTLRSIALDTMSAIDAQLKAQLSLKRRFDSLAWSPDGKRIALGARSFVGFPWTDLYLYDLEDLSKPKILTVISGWASGKTPTSPRPNSVNSIAFSPDNRWLVYSLRSADIYYVDLQETPLKPRRFTGTIPEYASVCFSSDSQTLLIYSNKESFCIPSGQWHLSVPLGISGIRHAIPDIEHGFHINVPGVWKQITNQGDLVRPDLPQDSQLFAQSIDGRYLMLAQTNRLQLFSPDQKHSHTLTIARRSVSHDGSCVPSWDKQGKRVISLDTEHSIARLWDLCSGTMACEIYLPGSPGTPKCSMSPDGSHFLLLELLGARLYEIRPQPELDVTALQVDPIRNFSVHPKYDWIAKHTESKYSNRQNISLTDIPHGKQFQFPIPLGMLGNSRGSPLHLTGEPPELSFIGNDYQANGRASFIRDNLFASRPMHRSILGLGHSPASIASGNSGRLWVAYDDQLFGYDSTGKKDLTWSNALLSRLGINPGIYDVFCQNDILALASHNGSTNVFRYQNGELISLLATLTTNQPLGKAALSTNGQYLFLGKLNGELAIHHLESKEHLGDFKVHDSQITGLICTPDSLVITSSQNGQIAYWSWEKEELKLLARYQGMPHVCRIGLSPNGVTLYSLHVNDHGIRVWHLDKIFTYFHTLGLGEGLPTLTPRPIVAKQLQPPELPPTNSGPGLRCEIYRLPRFLGPVTSRIDPAVDLGPSNPLVAPLDPQVYSARWTGVLLPPVAGRYKLRLRGAQHMTLWLEGKRRVAYSRSEQGDFTFEIDLENRPYQIKLEMENEQGDAFPQWTWTPPHQPNESLIGADHLFTDREAALKAQASAGK
jgi:serine/threonine protein kinase/WD40 repeat protein